MKVVLIAAIDTNNVIGNDGTIPWHYPEDFKHFKRTTTGHPVIMGRVTFESILSSLGNPLPDRENIVLTRSANPNEQRKQVHIVSSIEDALSNAEQLTESTAFVIGGASIYRQFLPHADELLLTHIPDAYDGDTFFPDYSCWTEVESWDLDETLRVSRYHRTTERI